MAIRRRDVILALSVLVLLCLLILLYLSLVYNMQTAGRLFLLFAYVLEIVVALSTAVIASEIAGSLTISLEERISKVGRTTVRAAGGFAIFLLVMLMSPRKQISEVADAIFLAELADCQSAALATPPLPDAEAHCLAVAERYPNRLEPRAVLAALLYRLSPLDPANLTKSRDYFLQALHHYELNGDETTEEIKERFPELELSKLRRIVYGAAIQTANVSLRSLHVKLISRDEALDGIDEARRHFQFVKKLNLAEADSGFQIRVIACSAIMDLYVAYLSNTLTSELLETAKQQFRQASDVDRHRAAFQHYNIFVVSVEQAYRFSETKALDQAKTAVKQFIDMLPIELESARNSVFGDRIKTWLRQIISNERDDPFVVTRPIGGHVVAGESMKKFFDQHPDIRDKLSAIAGN